MSRLSAPDQIWVLRPSDADREIGVKYARISLPWTFNRMMFNTSATGQMLRAHNIVKGIVAQEVLRHALAARGLVARTQRKSHRDEDFFDFEVVLGSSWIKLDIKTFSHYIGYPGDVREPLTAAFVVDNAAYPGPDWRRFFPMMIAHTQIRQEKEAYCFAIASSVDFRKDVDVGRTQYRLHAFPYGDHLPFLSFPRLCRKREEASAGIYLECSYESQGGTISLLPLEPLSVKVIGEWRGQIIEYPLSLVPGRKTKQIGPFSIVSSFEIDVGSYRAFSGEIHIRIVRNDLKGAVRNVSGRDINVPPDGVFRLGREHFCNLYLPEPYTLYFLGWQVKRVFARLCESYPAWIWPNDKVNRYHNQPWIVLTARDRANIKGAGFEHRILGKPPILRSGWLKTTGRGGGACCYVYPNQHGGSAGVSETNLYILPQNLEVMDDLGRISRNETAAVAAVKQSSRRVKRAIHRRQA